MNCSDGLQGLFGTACATMGMLCTAVFILSMNNFGPIADNGGGIVEMSEQPETVRKITDCMSFESKPNFLSTGCSW